MRRVEQTIITANDSGTRRPGEYLLPEQEAAALVAGGWAVYLDEQVEQTVAQLANKETTIKKTKGRK